MTVASPIRLSWLLVPNVCCDFGVPTVPAVKDSNQYPILGKGGWGLLRVSIRKQGAGSEGQGEAVTPTGLGAEAVLLVAVIVLGGAAPAVAVSAALGGAAVVGCALESERELAGLSIAVATQGEQG